MIEAPSDSPINGGEKSYRKLRVIGDRIRGLAKYVERQRDLRANETPAEKILWNLVRMRRVRGKKFRRQHGIGLYIVDLYCDEAKLVIEIDGSVHDSDAAKKYDEDREEYLRSAGYAILRIRNEEIMNSPVSVIKTIERTLDDISPPFMGESEGALV
ncbi:MAG: endonuclease domain-containing protein [Patescibacteria group bacterium]